MTRADSRRDSEAALLTASAWPLAGEGGHLLGEEGASLGPCPTRVSCPKSDKGYDRKTNPNPVLARNQRVKCWETDLGRASLTAHAHTHTCTHAHP